jgi:hypothetical protein
VSPRLSNRRGAEWETMPGPRGTPRAGPPVQIHDRCAIPRPDLLVVESVPVAHVEAPGLVRFGDLLGHAVSMSPGTCASPCEPPSATRQRSSGGTPHRPARCSVHGPAEVGKRDALGHLPAPTLAVPGACRVSVRPGTHRTLSAGCQRAPTTPGHLTPLTTSAW